MLIGGFRSVGRILLDGGKSNRFLLSIQRWKQSTTTTDVSQLRTESLSYRLQNDETQDWLHTEGKTEYQFDGSSYNRVHMTRSSLGVENHDTMRN